MPDNARSSPRSPIPVLPYSLSNNLKRKEPPDDDGEANSPGDNFVPAQHSSSTTNTAHANEYEAGFITCLTCSTEVSFRDDNNHFTTRLWDAHRMTCSTSRPPASSSGQVIFAPESVVAHTLGHPPTKRRRAKRTEEQRIEYFRSDPYVGQFEAYRVLCASCDRWIRLQPNSTYCSIPWDVHRKSCLAKKINNKNVYALEERNSSSATRIPQEVQHTENQRSPAISDPSSPKCTISSTPQHSITPPQADVTHHRHYKSHSAPMPCGPSASNENEVDTDAEGEADMDTHRDAKREILNRDKTPKIPTTPTANSSTRRAIKKTRGTPKRPLLVGLAKLDSPAGRKRFIFSSVEYLFSSTYESTDEMSIAALLAYLNAAMPPDKNEDFDTMEVVCAVASMRDKGKVVFEGDILRLPVD